MFLDTGREAKFQNWMAASIARIQFPLNFLMKEIVMRCCHFRIIKLCDYFKAFIIHLYIMSLLGVWLIRRSLDWMIGFIYTIYIYTFRDYRQYNAIAILHTFQFTVTNALGFSVLTSRILATDLSQSHCNYNSHMKYSWHNLIHFLPLPVYHHLPSPEIDPILSTILLYSVLLCSVFWLCPLITLCTDPTENTVFYCQECLFTDPLPSNRCPSLACTCFAGMCLPSRCLAMSIHVTWLPP
jgi:hypothetical protein